MQLVLEEWNLWIDHFYLYLFKCLHIMFITYERH